MKNKGFIQTITLVLVAALAVFSIGCGGGGGGGGGGGPVGPGTDYDPTSVVAPNTVTTLNQSAKLYNYRSTAANTAVVIPVESGKVVRYAMTITNTGNVAQEVNVRPESYVLNNQVASIKANSIISEIGVDFLHQSRINQYEFEIEMRKRFRDSMNAKLHASRRLASMRQVIDNSAETVGTEKNFFLESKVHFDSVTYAPRPCRLVRMIPGKLKIFVDKSSVTIGGEEVNASHGKYMITDEYLDHIEFEFITHMLPNMTNHYGKIMDYDNDDCLTIVFSPVYPSLGWAGLFNPINMNPTNPTYSNQRDMIGIWSPNSRSTGDKWLMDARETIVHEMQHAINFSAKIFDENGQFRYSGSSDEFNDESFMECYWLDESLSVGSEARYRIWRNQTSIYDARFDSWTRSRNLYVYGIESWAGLLEHYGQKGIFNLFLFEKFEGPKIKEMVQTTKRGRDNVESVTGEKLENLAKDFSMTVLIEGLRTRGVVNSSSFNAGFKYIFSRPVGFSLNSEDLDFGIKQRDSFRIPALGTSYYTLAQPAGFSASEYRFRIESTEGQPIEIMMMRLP